MKWFMSEAREIVDFLEDAIGAMEKAERFVVDNLYAKSHGMFSSLHSHRNRHVPAVIE